MTKSHSATLIAVLSGIWAEIASFNKHLIGALIPSILMTLFFIRAIGYALEDNKEE